MGFRGSARRVPTAARQGKLQAPVAETVAQDIIAPLAQPPQPRRSVQRDMRAPWVRAIPPRRILQDSAQQEQPLPRVHQHAHPVRRAHHLLRAEYVRPVSTAIIAQAALYPYNVMLEHGQLGVRHVPPVLRDIIALWG